MKLEESSLVTNFRCLHCGNDHPSTFTGYVCTECGGNLDVGYDYDRMRQDIATGSLLNRERHDIFRYAKLLPIHGLDHIPLAF